MLSGLADLDQDTLIPLYELSEFNLANPYETFYFCNYAGVSFEGIEYQAIACESTGYDLVGQGQIPQPNITISNVGRVIGNILYQLTNQPGYRLERSKFTRRLTKKKYLDGQPNAGDSIKEYMPDIHVIEQLAEQTYRAVRIVLSTPFDLEGMYLPGRLALRSCGSIYRGDECGYVGTNMFTIRDQPTVDPTLDVCSKTLTGCKLRFGEYSVLPYGGYPGLGAFGG